MAFINEYITEEDCEKYNLREICGKHNAARHGHMYAREWTIDREREMFLIRIWTHRESEFVGWAFFWKGEWMFFEMTGKKGWGWAMPDGSSYKSLFYVKNLIIPNHLERECVMNDLREALTASPGSPRLHYAKRDVTVEFI